MLWILTGLNTSAVLLWDLWGVISVSQLVSSPVEISDIRIPSSKHCQGDDLLSAASFRNDDICTKYQREAQMGSQFAKPRDSLCKEVAYAVSVIQGLADEPSQTQKPK